MKLELKKVKHYPSMSEETICFEAELYADGKRIGHCKNNGQGGETYVNCWDAQSRDKFFEAEAYCKTLPPAFVFDERTISNNITFVVDELFNEWLKKKEDKVLEKDCEKGICYQQDIRNPSYKIAQWKYGNKPMLIKDLLNNPTSFDLIKNHCMTLKNTGYVILNKNLPFEV